MKEVVVISKSRNCVEHHESFMIDVARHHAKSEE